MASAGNNSYINKIVSLISTSNIRYEGTIYMIDNDTITLKNVRIFGTEDRECTVFIGVLKETKPVISFTRSGIRSINLIPQYSFYDPSIVDTADTQLSSNYNQGKSQFSNLISSTQKSDRNQFGRWMSQSDYLRSLPSDDEIPITNDFDFEESNKLFQMDMDPVNNTAPAYNKENFFDNLQGSCFERRNIPGRSYRRVDAETFGKSSLEQRNREYRQRNSYNSGYYHHSRRNDYPNREGFY